MFHGDVESVEEYPPTCQLPNVIEQMADECRSTLVENDRIFMRYDGNCGCACGLIVRGKMI
jgi:hypothetical protein